MVPETMTGKRRPARSKNVSSAKSAAFPFSVSKIVSTRKRSAPPSASPSIASPYEATRSSKRTLRAPGSLTSGDIDAVRLVGPSAPATKRGLSGRLQRPGVGAFARKPRRRDVDLPHAALEPIIGLRDRGRVERVGADDVRARLQIRVVDCPDDVGLRQRKQIVVALEVMVVRDERGAAILGLAELVALDHRSHRPVEDENPLLEERGELGSAIGLHALDGTASGVDR